MNKLKQCALELAHYITDTPPRAGQSMGSYWCEIRARWPELTEAEAQSAFNGAISLLTRMKLSTIRLLYEQS
jgi:hypothetical protein